MLMYLHSKAKQKNLGKLNNLFLLLEGHWRKEQDPDPDGTKMLRIRKGWLLFLDADGVGIKHQQPASSEVN